MIVQFVLIMLNSKLSNELTHCRKQWLDTRIRFFQRTSLLMNLSGKG